MKKHILLFSAILVLFSCKKENDSNPIAVNGNVVLNVHVIHHSWDVCNVNVYLEANTLVYPGPDSTLYDQYLTTDGYGKVTFTKLIPGNYYLYCSGYDTLFGAQVIGYKQVYLTQENLINNEMSVNLYVSE